VHPPTIVAAGRDSSGRETELGSRSGLEELGGARDHTETTRTAGEELERAAGLEELGEELPGGVPFLGGVTWPVAHADPSAARDASGATDAEEHVRDDVDHYEQQEAAGQESDSRLISCLQEGQTYEDDGDGQCNEEVVGRFPRELDRGSVRLRGSTLASDDACARSSLWCLRIRARVHVAE
jgi:hypothetical protein